MNRIDIFKFYINEKVSFKIEDKILIATGYNNNFVFSGEEVFPMESVTPILRNLNSMTKEEMKEVFNITFNTECDSEFSVQMNDKYFTMRNKSFLLQIYLSNFNIRCLNGSDLYFPSFKVYNYFIHKHFDVFNINK